MQPPNERDGVQNCLICFNSYSTEHNKKLCGNLPLEASEKLFNSCARHLYTDIVDDNFSWDHETQPLLPFCWECFHFSTKLSRMNNKLEAIEKEIIQLVDNYTATVLNSRKTNLSAKKAREELSEKLENVAKNRPNFQSRSNFLMNMRTEHLRAIQNKRRPVRLFPLRTPKVVVEKLKSGPDGKWIQPKPKNSVVPTIRRKLFIKPKPKPNQQSTVIEIIDLSPEPSPAPPDNQDDEKTKTNDSKGGSPAEEIVKVEEKPPSPFFQPEDPLKCSFCQEVFPNVDAKTRHRICHSVKFVPQLCDLCGKVCTDYRRLLLHTKQHEEEGMTFKCEICDKIFSRAQGLKMHMYIHSEETPYTCDQCGKGFRCKPNLTAHLKVHKVDDDTPFKCPTCNYTYNSLEKLHNHQKRCTSVKEKFRFKCEDCDNFFANRRTLLLHEFLKHNKGQMFNCDFENCVKSFVSSAALKAHKKRYHSVHYEVESIAADSGSDDGSSSEYQANFQSLDLSMQNSHLQLINHHSEPQQPGQPQVHQQLQQPQQQQQQQQPDTSHHHQRHSHTHETLNIPQLPLANYRPPVIQQPVAEYRQQVKSLAPVDYRTSTSTTTTSSQQLQHTGYSQHFQQAGYSQHFQVQPTGFSQHFQAAGFPQHFPTTSTSSSNSTSHLQTNDYRQDISSGGSGGSTSGTGQSSRQNFPIQNTNYYQKLQIKDFRPVDTQSVTLPTNSLQALQFQTKELQQQVQALSQSYQLFIKQITVKEYLI